MEGCVRLARTPRVQPSPPPPPASPSCESETVARHELLDGPPVRGESVPIRRPLSSYDLTPTYRNVHNKVRGRGWGWGCVGLG